MATTEPRKPPKPRPLAAAMRSSFERFKKRAAVENKKPLHALCSDALALLDQYDRVVKAAELRAQADALEAGDGEA